MEIQQTFLSRKKTTIHSGPPFGADELILGADELIPEKSIGIQQEVLQQEPASFGIPNDTLLPILRILSQKW